MCYAVAIFCRFAVLFLDTIVKLEMSCLFAHRLPDLPLPFRFLSFFPAFLEYTSCISFFFLYRSPSPFSHSLSPCCQKVPFLSCHSSLSSFTLYLYQLLPTIVALLSHSRQLRQQSRRQQNTPFFPFFFLSHVFCFPPIVHSTPNLSYLRHTHTLSHHTIAIQNHP